MSFQDFNGESRELLKFVSEALFQDLQDNETMLVEFRGEETDFVRWNQSKIRQNTSVLQRELAFEMHKDGKRTTKSFSAQGIVEQDLMTARMLLQEARVEFEFLPTDPFLVPFKNQGTSLAEYPGKLLAGEDLLEAIARPSAETDMAGLYAGGTIATGNRNSLGQDHWFANETFFMDYSLYHGERAVKACYAGSDWQQPAFNESIRQSRQQLEIMNRPRKKIESGKYKVYLAPAAIAEMAQIFDMGALSFRQYKNGACAFKKVVEKEAAFSPLLNISENFKLGLSPQFNSLGELAAERVELILQGKLEELLINSRSAKEYSVPSNYASPSWESPRALDIGTGSLSKEAILKELGTGLYLSNLHYLNWSDLQNARITGMTRYACMWVENGQIVAPIEDMRFDVSVLDIWGPDLIAVTDFSDVDPLVGTYSERALGGRRLPGMLIKDFSFTL